MVNTFLKRFHFSSNSHNFRVFSGDIPRTKQIQTHISYNVMLFLLRLLFTPKLVQCTFLKTTVFLDGHKAKQEYPSPLQKQ